MRVGTSRAPEGRIALASRKRSSKYSSKKRRHNRRRPSPWRRMGWGARLCLLGTVFAATLLISEVDVSENPGFSNLLLVVEPVANGLEYLLGRAAFVLPTALLLLAVSRKWYGHYLKRRRVTIRIVSLAVLAVLLWEGVGSHFYPPATCGGLIGSSYFSYLQKSHGWGFGGSLAWGGILLGLAMTAVDSKRRQRVTTGMTRALMGLLRSAKGVTTTFLRRVSENRRANAAHGGRQESSRQRGSGDPVVPLPAGGSSNLGDWSPSLFRQSLTSGSIVPLPSGNYGPGPETGEVNFKPNSLFPNSRPLDLDILEDECDSDPMDFSEEEAESYQQVIADVVEDTTGFRILPARNGFSHGLTTLEFRFALARRQRRSVEAMRHIQSDLELALGRKPVRVVFDQDIRVIVPLRRSERRLVPIRRLIEEAGVPGDGSVNGLLGRTNTGHPFTIDFRQDPHCLVAGSTGSGKSVGLKSLIFGFVFRYSSTQVRLVIADHKCELTQFRGLPHLWRDIVTTKSSFQRLLADLRDELERRKSIEDPADLAQLPLLAVIIDEFHGFGCSEQLMGLVAEARSFGIHFVLATQHPTADVISTTVKANLLTRIAFRVANESASRLVLDEPGASKLLGKGDCLIRTVNGVQRVQAAWVSSAEEGQDSDIVRLQKYLREGPRQEVSDAV